MQLHIGGCCSSPPESHFWWPVSSKFAIGVTFGEALARNSAVESHDNIVAPDGSGAGSVARARRRASNDFSAEAVATAANQATIDEKAKQASLDARRASDDFSAEALAATAANQASAIDEKAKQASLDAKAIALQEWRAKQVRSHPWHFPTA